MIYITGDTHGELKKLYYLNASFEDIIIITGDFGFIWNDLPRNIYLLKKIAKYPFTVAFVDGNHENFRELLNYPEEQWNNGKIGRISSNVIHLKRGQVFTIEGKTIFTMGGGISIDKEHRIKDISWWKEEELSARDIEEGFSNLDKVNWIVDYVITHELPNKIMQQVHSSFGEKIRVRKILDEFDEKLSFKIWYSGHYHNDVLLSKKYQILYNKILLLGEIIS